VNATKTLRVAQLGTVDYQRALALQNALVAARQRADIEDTLLLLEHPHVFTLGRGADDRFLLARRPSEVPVYRISRGGQVTYHGPGQLVSYPILKLEGQDCDVHDYLRKIEDVVIRALDDCGIGAGRRDGLTGIWVGNRKIGSIGVGIKRWTTYHGFAVNVAPDLQMFSGIVPCGIDGCEMTSISALGHSEVTTEMFSESIRAAFIAVFKYSATEKVPASEVWQTLQADSTAETIGHA
jgi:lipoyl(octanoyl) transferase